jgi:putative ABC transport system substrate-binding protein
LIIPGLKTIYLPYNPEDEVSIVSLSGLDELASKLGISLIYHKVHSSEEAIAGIKRLSGEGNAVYMIPSPTLNSRGRELSQAAIDQGIPMCASVPLDKDVLITLATDLYTMGKQTARLAHQIFQGVKPSDIPFETSELNLTINLKTAEKIGVKVPNDVLAQATNIIR